MTSMPERDSGYTVVLHWRIMQIERIDTEGGYAVDPRIAGYGCRHRGKTQEQTSTLDSPQDEYNYSDKRQTVAGVMTAMIRRGRG